MEKLPRRKRKKQKKKRRTCKREIDAGGRTLMERIVSKEGGGVEHDVE